MSGNYFKQVQVHVIFASFPSRDRISELSITRTIAARPTGTTGNVRPSSHKLPSAAEEGFVSLEHCSTSPHRKSVKRKAKNPNSITWSSDRAGPEPIQPAKQVCVHNEHPSIHAVQYKCSKLVTRNGPHLILQAHSSSHHARSSVADRKLGVGGRP